MGVTGSIAAWKACEIVSLLRKRGHSVRVIMTANATRFITELSLATLSGYPVCSDMFGEHAYEPEHISLADWADLLLVAPADANIIAKMAAGIADDMLSTVYLACRCPVYIAPAMNTAMYEHPANRANMELLAARGCAFIGPDSGRLACGAEGKGRLSSPETIVDAVTGRGDYAGRCIVVTAGATMSPIDPVRFITNHSSGKMGAALCEAALRRGARVIAVTGRVSAAFPPGARVEEALTNEDMYRALKDICLSEKPDAVIAAAAPCDYACEPSPAKIKKNGRPLELTLTEARDVIGSLAAEAPGPALVGFAAETGDPEANARLKLERKKLDMIVANDVSRAVFGSDYDSAVIIKKDGSRTATGRIPKRELADVILDELAGALK